MIPRIFVAGVGNLFLADEGFGVEVAKQLAGHAMPEGVTVADYGIGAHGWRGIGSSRSARSSGWMPLERASRQGRVERPRRRKYPRIRGEVREVTASSGAGRYRVRGDLSLRGVTKSIEGEVTLQALDEKTVQVDGEKTLDVREFGLQPPKFLMLQVYPEVRVRARIVAVREG
jgi:hypothetical protein